MSKATASIFLAGRQIPALFDSGSSENFINPTMVKSAGLRITPKRSVVSMASSNCWAGVEGTTSASFSSKDHDYQDVSFSVMDGLCAYVILRLDFQTRHETIIFEHGGKVPLLSVCVHLTAHCKPVAVKSRKYSHEDRSFIRSKLSRLLNEGIVEASQLPWRVKYSSLKGKARRNDKQSTTPRR